MRGVYQQDPYLLQFRSKVIGSISENNKLGVLVQDTIFYPEGGGQPCDRGTLVCARKSYEVLYVEERPEGIIHWITGSKAPSPGTEILMTVDADRRRDHMQQHHGQHIVSAVFERQYGIQTVGFHLGEETSTIDLSVSTLTDEILDDVEIEANNIVMENLPVQTELYKREQLAPEIIKKIPPEQVEVRLVIIPGVDENPCCGTHPRYTGEVGPIKFLKTEKMRGNTRLHFLCGQRAVNWMQTTFKALQGLERAAGATGKDAVDRINRRELELKQFIKERKELLSYKYRLLAEELKEEESVINGVGLLIKHYPEGDIELLRGLASVWCADKHKAAVLTAGNGPYDLVIAQGEGIPKAANGLAEVLWPIVRGRGGGNNNLVQGKVQELPLDDMVKAVEEYYTK